MVLVFLGFDSPAQICNSTISTRWVPGQRCLSLGDPDLAELRCPILAESSTRLYRVCSFKSEISNCTAPGPFSEI